jgi:8-oxo-dGTP pyrophosphatase MutT (NUDIX family)
MLRERAGVVLLNPKTSELLLIERYKFGRHYFVLPGGRRKKTEETIDAAVREIHEELDLQLEAENLSEFITFVDELDKVNTYYITTVETSDHFTIHGEELERSSEDNQYLPTWVPVSKLANLPIVPQMAKDEILNSFKSDNHDLPNFDPWLDNDSYEH